MELNNILYKRLKEGIKPTQEHPRLVGDCLGDLILILILKLH